MKKLILNLILSLAIIYCIGQDKTAIEYGNNMAAGGYKKINGINMYYEIYGSGKPLIFLHGSFSKP